MPGFNGNGVYVRPYNWTNDAANSIDITASRFDTDGTDVATALSTCICKDGQQTTTARIPFAVGLSINAGSNSSPSIAVLNDLTTGFYQATTGALSFASGGTLSATFNANGLDSTPIGGGTPAAGAFTTLSGTSSLTLGVSASTNGTVVLKGSTSGSTTIQPNVTATGTLTLPAATDTLVGKATTDTLTNKTLTSPVINSGALGASSTATTQTALDNSTKLATTAYADTAIAAGKTLGSPLTTTSGTTAGFTGLPAGLKRITMIFYGVSTSGTSPLIIQIGSGSYTSSGYASTGATTANAASPGTGSGTAGFVVEATGSATAMRFGTAVLTRVSANLWVSSGTLADTTNNTILSSGGANGTLGGALDRIQLTTTNGTDTFDAGTLNILYE